MSSRLLVLFAGFCLLVFRVSAQTGAPTVASLSNSQTLTEGHEVTLSVSVNGNAPFTYQWRKDGTNIAGATTSTLAFTPIRTTNAGTYTVVITNSVGSVTSGPVVLAVNPAVAPNFYYPMGNVSVTVGNTINLYAPVDGTAPMTFVWKRGTTTLATTTSNYYSKASAESGDAGSYTVTVSNIAGTVTSTAFTVTVNPVTAPTFSYNISDVTVPTGGSFYFYPSVNSAVSVTYQWKKDGVNIPSATSAYYSVYDVTASHAGTYTLTVTNSAGSVTSNGAKVTVQPPVAPTISSVSGPVAVIAGESFGLSVYVNGTGPLAYQWYKDGQAISGATSSYYSKSSAAAADAGSYTVVVTNPQGSATSSGILVTIANARPPVITYHPPSFALHEGTSSWSISVGASGTGSLTYQWSKNGTPIPGAISSSYYSSGGTTAAHAGTYTVVVTSAQGSATSEPCHLTILPPIAPVITMQPASRTVRQGAGLSLSANVQGTPYPTFQWRKDGANIAGATQANYHKSNTASSDAGLYSFVATNSAGSVTSDNATITVIAVGAPKILAHPASASLLPGDSFYGMYIGYQSNTNATVQWYRDGNLIPGATSSSYYIYNAQPAIAGTYLAIVTNSAGSATSREAVVTVDANTTRPVITYVQGSRAVRGSESISLGIATSSSGETIQWFKDGLIIPNATSKTYSFSNFALSSVGTYTAQVTTTAGTFTSRPIVLELQDAGIAPLITVQPASRRSIAGASAYFSVLAEGEAPLTYQWRKDGVAIPNATWSEYSIGSPTATHAGSYSVVVTNRNGSTTSTAASLTVTPGALTAPVITQHPASMAFASGSGWSSFSVGVLDSAGVTYQWKKDGVAIAGATSNYFYPGNSGSAAGRYSVVVTNSLGSVTSYDAVLTLTSVATGPTFTVQPQSVSGYYGNTITFNATATSTSTISYQWRKNGTPIPGATSSSLTLNSVQSSDAATYTVLATDANGSTPSAAATLTLAGGVTPFIIASPTSVSALAGTGVMFSVSAGGTPVPTVQWQRNGIDLPGATSFVLNLANVQAVNEGTYTAVARSSAGSATSAAATLTVIYPPPTIATQPANVSVQPGNPASFTVVVTSIPVPTYQWRKDGINIPGATGSTLTMTNVQSTQAGRYSVLVTTSFGSVTSVDALLTVGNPVIASVPAHVVASAGGNATITASVQSVDPLVFQWARNGVPIAGATGTTLSLSPVQPGHAGTYSFGIFRPDGTVVYPLTGSAALTTLFTVEIKLLPVIVRHPFDSSAAIGGTITLTVAAQSTGPLTFQWQKNGVPIPDRFTDTLTLTNVQPSDAGEYRAVAMNANGSTASNTARVTILGSAYAGSYFGTFGSGDAWALHVNPDGLAVFVALLGSRSQAIVDRNVIVSPSGSFRFGQARAIAAQGGSAIANQWFDGEVLGQIQSNGAVSGLLPSASLAYTGFKIHGTPAAGIPPGHYQAVPIASDMGQIDAIAAPDGSVFLVAVDAKGVRGGRGTTNAAGAFLVSQPNYIYQGTVAGASGQLQGVYNPTGGTAIAFATPASPASAERLMNVATRGLAGSGSRTLTAGFVISGNAAKDVLIRAVGPGLSTFGVSGVLPNPRLRIFRDGTPIIENDDWSLGGFATQIAEASVRVGAFALPAGSADSAVIARLEPGAYTAQISGEGDTPGVALVEVYDTTIAAAGAPKLINLSTRGEVGRDADILIVGIVVSGSAPKRLLIRGVGPTLETFGVTGVLADPRLQLFQGGTLIRENDNWSDSPDAATLATTATAVGAFTLPSGSKDAVLLVYLAPGNYTAQISGINSTTGVALVELYEVP